jgi:hypothetical protein
MNSAHSTSRAASAAVAAPAPAYAARSAHPGFSDIPDDFRLNLSDVPLTRGPEAMQVDGFKPTLFSRMFSLFSK